MPKVIGQDCVDCQHFYELSDIPGVRCGECRKNAPVHVDDDGYGHWPWVKEGWWCGDWHVIVEED